MSPALTKKGLFLALPLCIAYMTALAIYNLFQELSSIISELPSKFRQREVAPYDTSIRVDPLSVLPVEIVQQILLHLPPASYISTKFVNHDFHAATLLSSGHDLRGFRGTRDTKNPDQHEYVSGVIELEIHTRYRLELLSCYHCGKRAGNDLNGFSDEQFGQAFEYRACLKCRKSCSATVKGVVVRRCHSCNQYVAGEAGEDGEWMPVPAH